MESDWSNRFHQRRDTVHDLVGEGGSSGKSTTTNIFEEAPCIVAGRLAQALLESKPRSIDRNDWSRSANHWRRDGNGAYTILPDDEIYGTLSLNSDSVLSEDDTQEAIADELWVRLHVRWNAKWATVEEIILGVELQLAGRDA